MAYSTDLKSVARKGLRVQIPPPVPVDGGVFQLVEKLDLDSNQYRFESYRPYQVAGGVFQWVEK